MSERRNSPYLLDEPPLFVYRSLAVLLGINKAIVFQELHLLLNNQKTARNEYVFINERWWVYNSYPEWRREYFPWLAEITLKRIFNELEDDKLVLSRQGVKKKSDRRKWYTIDYLAWEYFCQTNGSKRYDGGSDQNDPIMGSKRADDSSDRPSDRLSEKKDIVSGETESPLLPEGTILNNGATLHFETTKTIHAGGRISEATRMLPPSPPVSAPPPASPKRREPDAMFEAIKTTWQITAGGWVGQMRAMLLGTAKKGEWKDANFDPPATADEVLAFGKYMTDRRRRERITQKITQPATIQRWFYDFRATRDRAGLGAPAPAADPTPGVKPLPLTAEQRRERAKQFLAKGDDHV